MGVEDNEVTLLVKMIDAVRTDIEEVRQLGERTYAETRKTNGRVTTLEGRMDVIAAHKAGRAEMGAEQQRRQVRRMDQWHWRIATIIAVAATVTGFSAAISQLFH